MLRYDVSKCYLKLSLSSCEGRASEQNLNEMYVNRDCVSCNCRRRSGPDQWQWQEQLPVTERQCARRGEVNLIARNRFRRTCFNTTQRRRPRPEWLTIHSPSHPPTQPARQIDTQMRFRGANAMHCIACTVRCFDSICRCVVLVVALLLLLFWASPCCWHCGLFSSHLSSFQLCLLSGVRTCCVLACLVCAGAACSSRAAPWDEPVLCSLALTDLA